VVCVDELISRLQRVALLYDRRDALIIYNPAVIFADVDAAAKGSRSGSSALRFPLEMISIAPFQT